MLRESSLILDRKQYNIPKTQLSSKIKLSIIVHTYMQSDMKFVSLYLWQWNWVNSKQYNAKLMWFWNADIKINFIKV